MKHGAVTDKRNELFVDLFANFERTQSLRFQLFGKVAFTRGLERSFVMLVRDPLVHPKRLKLLR